MPPHVLIVTDDPWVRVGLAAMLREVELEVVQPGDEQAPEVVLWAADLESLATEQDAPILVLLADQSEAIPALRAGASGVLLRDSDPSTLGAALAAVARGLSVLEPRFLASLLPEPQAQSGLEEELSAREHEVLQLLAAGLPNKTIAKRLEVSEHTAKFHVAQILSKLGASSRTEAVVRAAQLGLVLL